MTLLLGLVSERIAVLAADRRTTWDGQIKNEEFNKLTVFFGIDARVAVAFTGLASFGVFNTDDWLVETLTKAVEKPFDGVLHELRTKADATLSQVPPAHRALAFMIVGFVYAGGTSSPVACTVSNFLPGGIAGTNFELSRATVAGQAITVAGALTSLRPAEQNALERVLGSTADSPNVVRAAIGMIQRIARDGRSRGLVGQQCNSVVVQPEVDSVVVSTYHSAYATGEAWCANAVSPGGVFTGSRIKTSEVMTGPEIRKKDPCWCASGKLFKHCHMKTCGSVSVRGLFSAPLPFTVSVEANPGFASGRRFIVSSSFT
jgi:hypothetical protein